MNTLDFASEIKQKISDCIDHPLFSKDVVEHAKILTACLRSIERDCDLVLVAATIQKGH